MPDRPAWTDLHARLHRTLRQRQLLPAGQPILVAVSGGQDSLCLLRLLLDLQPQWRWQLAIAHCNHRWRSDADANADAVRSLAQRWQLPDYDAVAEEVVNSEAAARHWRYRALTNLAQQHDYAYIATGHTSSDRAETLLYNLVRGSGADGLQALAWQRQIAPNLWLVRPLLEVSRAETGQFCRAANLPVWEDSTNQDWHYARNRIRSELLPYLETHFNPQAQTTLSQTAELLRAEVEFLEACAQPLWEQAIDLTHPPKLNRRTLQAAPLALQRRVLRRWLAEGLAIAPSFEQIEKLVGLLAMPNRSQTDPFPGGAIVQVQGDWLVVCDRDQEATNSGV